MLLKLGIGMFFISYHSVDLDEPFSIFHAQSNFSGLFEIFNHENNPPLHFILLHFWEQIFGISPSAVRSLSLLFSVGTIVVIWKIGNTFFSRKVAIFTCLFFIFSDFHQYYGLEARAYSLLVFVYSITLYLIFKLLLHSTETTWKTYLWLGIANLALFYSHYISLLIFAAQGLLFLRFSRIVSWKGILLSIGIFLLGLLPWLPILIGRITNVANAGTWLSTANYSELYGFLNKFLNDKWVFALVLMVGLSYFIFQFSDVRAFLKKHAKLFTLLLILFFVPFLSAFVLSRLEIAEVFYDRYLFFLTLPLFLGISFFFQSIPTYSSYATSLVLLFFLLRFDIQPENNRETNNLVTFVKESNANDIVIFPEYYDIHFLYHYDQRLFKDTAIRKKLKSHHIYPLMDVQKVKDLNLKGTIAVIDADFQFLQVNQNVKKSFLLNGYILLKAQQFKGNFTVYLFSK